MLNEKLTQMKINKSPECRHYASQVDTIKHMLQDCPKADSVWVKLKQWIEQLTGKSLHMSPSYILLRWLQLKIKGHLISSC